MIGRWAQRFATAIERPSLAYGMALGGVAAAAAVRGMAGLFMSAPPNYMFFYPAVLFATWAAGGRGGMLAVGASAALVWALWSPKAAPLAMWTNERLVLLMFVVTAMITVGLARAIRIAVQRGVAAEERFRIAQEASHDGFAILEPTRRDGEIADFRWIYCNPTAERMSPASVGSPRGRRVTEVFPGETGRSMVERLKAIFNDEGPDDEEVPRIIDGVEFWMRSSGVRLRDSVAVTFRDVTEQHAADVALRAAEARQRALMEALPQLLWSNRADGHCDYLSPQWTAYTGVEASRHFGLGWLEAVHPDDRDSATEAWSQAVNQALPYDIEVRIRRHDGAWRWFSMRATALRDDKGAITRWFGASTDITETVEARRDLEERVAERTRELEASLEDRARAEAALAQAQRLETVGRLTGGVAHDFNNLLTVVIGGLDMILRAPTDVARVTRLAEAALSAGRRGERLTRQLLAFSRRQELKLEVVDLHSVIEQAEPLVRRAVGETLDISVRCAADIGACRLDAAQFEAALLNLVVNAADATPCGGKIMVEATRVTLNEGEVQGAAAGDYQLVCVSDTGEGMSPEVLTRVFEPFFTTKEVGKGTGLGLAQVYGFASQTGGAVTIDSKIGEGTTVALYLPAADRCGPRCPALPAIRCANGRPTGARSHKPSTGRGRCPCPPPWW